MHFAMVIKHHHMLLGAKSELPDEADDFADEYLVGPFIISYDVVNDWLLFLNHKQHRYLYLADLNRLASVTKLILNGDIETATSWVLADFLDSVGTVISKGHWIIGPIHSYGDKTDGWRRELRINVQYTRPG